MPEPLELDGEIKQWHNRSMISLGRVLKINLTSVEALTKGCPLTAGRGRRTAVTNTHRRCQVASISLLIEIIQDLNLGFIHVRIWSGYIYSAYIFLHEFLLHCKTKTNSHQTMPSCTLNVIVLVSMRFFHVKELSA